MQPTVTLSAVGDVMFGRDVARTIDQIGIEAAASRLFEVLGPSAVAFGNLECPLSRRGTPRPYAETAFRAAPDAVQILSGAGFRVVSMANNHIHDYGREAIEDTLETLHRAGIAPVGIGQTFAAAREGVVFAADCGLRIGFLAYTSDARATEAKQVWKAAPLIEEEVMEDVARMRAESDAVFVSWHAGYEMVDIPSPPLRNAARVIIEAGADAIIGHGPHVLQGVERFGGKPVYYSLGNFVFDNPLARTRQQSVVVRLDVTQCGVVETGVTPVWIGALHLPEPADEATQAEITNRLAVVSAMLSDQQADGYYWNVVGSRIMRDQAGMLRRVYRKHGIGGLLRVFAKVRVRHLALAFGCMTARLRGLRLALKR